MKPIFIGFVVCAACGTEPPELEVDIPAMTSGLLGRPIMFSVTDADGTIVASGNSTGQPFRVPIQPDATLLIEEDLSSSPTSRFSSSFTITGLQPGDHVLHDRRANRTPSAGQMTVRFVDVPNLPSGSSYYFVAPCGGSSGSGGSGSLSFHEDCVPAGAFTVHGYVVDTTGPYLHTEIAVPGFRDGGTINATEVWSPVPTQSVTIRGFPPDASGALVRQQFDFVRRFDRIITPAAGDVVVELPVIAGPGNVATLAVVTTRTGALGVQRHFFGVDHAAPAVDLDLGLHPLPSITGPEVSDGGGVTWPQDGAGAPDFVRVTGSWSRGGPPYQGGSYEVLGPPGSQPDGGSTGGRLSLIDCPDPDGYQQVKQDHKRACSISGPGQVLVESVSPAMLTDSF